MTDKDKPKKKGIPRPRRSRTMFQCKCGKQFRTAEKLIKHMFKEHGE